MNTILQYVTFVVAIAGVLSGIYVIIRRVGRLMDLPDEVDKIKARLQSVEGKVDRIGEASGSPFSTTGFHRRGNRN